MTWPEPDVNRHRFALAFLFLLALPPFAAPLIRGEVFVVRDHLDYFQPLRAFTAGELREGRLPLWNPYNASGEPWLANPQTGVFYPPAWLFVVLPFPAAYVLFLFLHLVVLGWSAYLLFERSAPAGAAIVGAAAAMFSGPVLSLLDVNNNLATLSWVPLALWCAAAGAWKRGGAVLALAFLAGEPFFAALGGLMFAVVAIASAPAGGRGRAWRGVAVTAACAIGLSAVQLFPFLEMLRGSDRAAGMSAELVLRHSMAFSDWLRLADPRTAGAGSGQQQFIPMLYTGAVVVVLAAIGVVTGWRRRDVAGWMALLAVATVLSVGPSLLVKMPLTLFRYPARFVPLGALALAALAVAGWQRVRRDRRWLDLLVVLVIVADLLPRARPLLRAEPWRPDVVPYAREIGADAKILRVGEIDPRRRTAWMSGYLNLYQRRFEVFTAAPVASERYVTMHRELQQAPTPGRLASLGVGWLLTTLRLREPFLPVAGAAGVTMYRYAPAPPHALLRSGARVVPLRAEFGTSHARMTVDAAEPGTVELSQQNAPGWRVFVDGREAETLTISGLFRGVRVPAGRHEVAWRYRPASFVAGAVTTILTLFSLQLFLFVKPSRAEKFFFRSPES